MSPGTLMSSAIENKKPECDSKSVVACQSARSGFLKRFFRFNLPCLLENPDFSHQNIFDSIWQAFCCFSGFELCVFQVYVCFFEHFKLNIRTPA